MTKREIMYLANKDEVISRVSYNDYFTEEEISKRE